MKFKIFTATVVLSCSALISTSSVFASNLAKITASSVNLRSYNSTEARIVGTANTGDTVTILANANNGWFKINKSGVGVSFVNADFISIYQTDATCIAESVNVRTAPSTDSKILGVAKKGQVFVTTGKSDDWYQIKFNGATGYIYKDYMQGSLLKYLANAPAAPPATTSDKTTAAAISSGVSDNIYGVVDATSLNMRESADGNSKVLKALPDGYYLTLNGYKDGWIEVTDDSDTRGFVKAEYIILKSGKKPENQAAKAIISPIEYKNDGPVKASDVIEYAEQFLGTPYVWGGTSLTSGVDCSGFVYSVFKDFGIELNRTSRDMYTQGTAVSKEELEPADLIFFNSGGESAISHVAMYIGDGKYIHSTNGSGNGVVISSLDDAYSVKTYVGAKRVLK